CRGAAMPGRGATLAAVPGRAVRANAVRRRGRGGAGRRALRARPGDGVHPARPVPQRPRARARGGARGAGAPPQLGLARLRGADVPACSRRARRPPGGAAQGGHQRHPVGAARGDGREAGRHRLLCLAAARARDAGPAGPRRCPRRGAAVEAPAVSTIGVVVLTHNRAADLANTLRRLRPLPEAARLVVVDNASVDATADIVRRDFPDVELVRLPVNAGAAGRNAGVAHLDTTYVAFCDDDTWWAPTSLARAATLLDAYPALGLVCGRVLVGEDARDDPASRLMAISPLSATPGLPGRPILGFLCAASMVRRAAFLAAGGFEPRFFLGGEEELLALDLAAAGWALAYIDDIVVHHHPSPRRDAGRRAHLLLRNALWCAWMRRRL